METKQACGEVQKHGVPRHSEKKVEVETMAKVPSPLLSLVPEETREEREEASPLPPRSLVSLPQGVEVDQALSPAAHQPLQGGHAGGRAQARDAQEEGRGGGEEPEVTPCKGDLDLDLEMEMEMEMGEEEVAFSLSALGGVTPFSLRKHTPDTEPDIERGTKARRHRTDSGREGGVERGERGKEGLRGGKGGWDLGGEPLRLSSRLQAIQLTPKGQRGLPLLAQVREGVCLWACV